jgi:hypothetical protein
MLMPSHLFETLFANRYNFIAPDSGPHKVPYTCSFHWFHTADGRLIGLDLVRSDDMGRRALRVFAIDTEGKLQSLIREAPSPDWEPFATDRPAAIRQNKPALARGENWVAAAAPAPGQSIEDVALELDLKVLSAGKGTGEAGLLVAHMNAMDYLRVEISGWIEINRERINLDRVIGYSSVHFGDFLPNYAAVASVPPEIPGSNGILVNVIDSDDIRHGASLLGGKSLVYGYGCGAVPTLMVTVAQLENAAVPLGAGHLELSNVRSLPHVLLDRPTTSGVARATYVDGNGTKSDAGQVILDYRGPEYAPLIAN